MSITIDAARMRHALARRGLSARDLARHARLSVLTVRAALAGRPITALSFRLIAEALEQVPVLEVADSLLLVRDDYDAED